MTARTYWWFPVISRVLKHTSFKRTLDTMPRDSRSRSVRRPRSYNRRRSGRETSRPRRSPRDRSTAGHTGIHAPNMAWIFPKELKVHSSPGNKVLQGKILQRSKSSIWFRVASVTGVWDWLPMVVLCHANSFETASKPPLLPICFANCTRTRNRWISTNWSLRSFHRGRIPMNGIPKWQVSRAWLHPP